MIKALLGLFISTAITLCAVESDDELAIRSIIDGYVTAWNQQEGYGFANGFADDADFVNIVGMHFTGKPEIEKRHIKILETFLKGSKFKVCSIQLRTVAPTVISAVVKWEVKGFRFPGSDPHNPGTTRQGIFTHLFVKENGSWKISMCQNTLIPEQSR